MVVNRRKLLVVTIAALSVGAATWSAVADAQPPLNSVTSSLVALPEAAPPTAAVTPTPTSPNAPKTSGPKTATTGAASSTVPPSMQPTGGPSVPNAGSPDDITNFVKDALNAREAVGVTAAANTGPHALDATTIAQKSVSDTARLHNYFSGKAFDEAKLGLDSGINAEKRGDTRIIGGGSRVLSVSKAEVTGQQATVSGLEEDWLDTSMLLPGGWKVFPAYSQSTFVAALTNTGFDGWRITSYTSTRTPQYPH